MFLKNEDIDIMIKMENLVGISKVKLFGKNKDKQIIYKDTTISIDDFINYMNLIERILQNKKKLVKRCTTYNQTHKDYARIMSNMSTSKRRGNMEKYNYWKQQLEDIKTK